MFSAILISKDDSGKSPVVRKWPMAPGIDLVGVVSHSDHADWKAGDRVVLAGWRGISTSPSWT